MPIFDVRHQCRAHRILQRALSSRRLPHAYVFHGPAGVGKRTLATAFARLLLCPQPVVVAGPKEMSGEGNLTWQDACGRCEDCTLSGAGTHPDLQLVYKELNRYHPAPEVRARKALDLGVDVVRHFITDRVGDRPARGRGRVFVVLGADEMSVAAQNALLKTLEEPPDSAFILLVTRSLDRLLATTLSRCQPVPFGTLPGAFVEERLAAERPELSPQRRRFLAGYSDGRLGIALRQADDAFFEIKTQLNQSVAGLKQLGPAEFAQQVQRCASSLADRYVAERVESGMIDKASEASASEPTRRGLTECLALASCLYRDVMRIGCDRAADIVNVDQPDLVNTLAEQLNPQTAAAAIREIHRTENDIHSNANTALALEVLGIRLLRLQEGPAARRAIPALRRDA